MKTFRDKNRLINLSYNTIYIIIPNEQYDELVERVKALNKCSALTCGRFRFAATKKIQRMSTTLHPLIADYIGDNNLFVRLHGGIKKYFRYGYDFVDLTADSDSIEEAVGEFVKDICKDILKLLDLKLARLSESRQENEADIEIAKQKKEEYTAYCSQVEAERGVYKTVLSTIKTPNVKISIKNIQTIHYRKTTVRYGLEIAVNDTKVLLYIGDKTQSILYMAALVRFKMGQPLYLHELYRNSHGLCSVYKREKTYKWFARIFDDLFGRTSSFEKWTTPIRNNQPTPRSGHDFNQAKSAVEDKLEALLVGNLASALDCCRLHSACDANGDTYYTFNCKPEDIILDETAQKWSILFKKLYSLR